MLRAEVCLCELLALRVELDGSVEASKLFVLLTDTEVGHDLDGNEVTQLEVQTLNLWIWTIG